MIRKLLLLVVSMILLFGLVGFPAQAATPDEIADAIEDGIAWLVDQQSAVNGSWEGSVGITAFAVLKLEDRAFELEFDSPFDEDYPYHQNVIDGLNFIFNNLVSINIAVQPAGDPDTNGNGVGIYVNSQDTYDTGIAMMAIAGSRSPDRLVAVGAFTGETYKRVLQDMADYFAWGQSEVGNARGGWGYSHNESGADNSNSGYAVLGLQYAQAPLYGFNSTIPAFVKTELSMWIDYIQNDVDGDILGHDGGSAYSTWNGPNYWVNELKTGNLLGQMAFAGDDPSDARVQDALDYIARHWNDASLVQGWGKGLNPIQYQAAYCLMKGLTYMGIPLDGIAGVADWYQELADEIVPEQIHPDADHGYWPQSYAYWWPNNTPGHLVSTILSTEWALLTLERFAPPPPIVIEVTKGYTYTDVCFERDDDLDGLFNEDPVDFDAAGNPIDNDGDGLYNEDPVCCPDGTSLGTPLPTDEDGAYLLQAVVNKKGIVTSYNPGQYYAVSTVNVLADIEMLTIEEDFSDCVASGISALNPEQGGGAVVVVQVGPDDDIAYQILDAKSPEVSISGGVATVELGAQEAGTTILVYVKFSPGLKGMEWADVTDFDCENTNSAWYVEEPEEGDVISATAMLMLSAK